MLTNLMMQGQSPSGSGSLPSDTVANPRGDVKVTRDKLQTTSSKSTAHVHPPVVRDLIPKPEVFLKPNPKPSIPYPSRLNNQKLQEKTGNQMMKFLQIFQRLHFDISFGDALLHMPKFAFTFKSLLSNKEKLFELATSADLGASINLMPLSIWKKLSLLELTPTRMTLELANRSIVYPVSVAEDVFVKVRKFHFLADFVVAGYDVNPRVPLILERPFLRTTRALNDVHDHSPNLPLMKNKELKHVDVTLTKPSIEEPPKLKLNDLPSHLEYTFSEDTNKLPIIIAKNLKDEEKDRLLKVLKSQKHAITWKISDIKGIDP
nr:reverse transcriptase domain-containing protein [Tanacetum cinerariifolium]